jgi:putative NADPH-quinone reductase
LRIIPDPGSVRTPARNRKGEALSQRIAIIDGHPDPERSHFCHAAADAYRQGAEESGHEVRLFRLGDMEVPLLRSQREWENDPAPAGIRECQEAIGWADHIVIVFPLWLGGMPAMLKALLEQIFRPGFAFKYNSSPMGEKLLKGKSARVIVTMGMPAFVYRLYFRAHSLRSLKRNILGFVGIGPIRTTIIGSIAAMDDARHRQWLEGVRVYGYNGQ